MIHHTNKPLYLNKYRSESTRLRGYDYARPGWYFITICTKHREPILGEIIDGYVHLSAIGQIVHDEWIKSFSIRQELQCDIWVIMPDHLHGIVWIRDDIGGGLPHSIWPPESPRTMVSPDTPRLIGSPNTPRSMVDTHGRAYLPSNGGITTQPSNGGITTQPSSMRITTDPSNAYKPSDNEISNTGVAYRPPKSISSFAAGFKSAATVKINVTRNTPRKPVWQALFHDRIIRDHHELNRIRRYIVRNPIDWYIKITKAIYD